MPFFSDTGPGGFQPKRAFRFLVTFSELANLTFMVKTAKKPSYQLATKEHNILNHVFKFPGVLKWNDVDTIGEVSIKQLDGGGIILPPGSDPGEVAGAIDTTNIVEEWVLKNAFLTKVAFGDTLDYSSEELINVSVTVTYDYAEYLSVAGGVPLGV